MSSCRWELSFVPAMSKCCTGTVSNSFDPINPTNRQIPWLRFFISLLLRASAETKKPCSANGLSQILESSVPVRGFHHIWNSASFSNHFLHWTELREGKYAPRALETGDLSPPEFNSDRQGLSRVSKWGLRLNLDPASAVRLTMRKEAPSSESYIEARILMLLVEIWFCIRIRFFVMVVINHRKEVCCYGEVVVVKLASDNILW